VYISLKASLLDRVVRRRRRGAPFCRPACRGPGGSRDDADALVGAEREHLALLLAVHQVVVVLHRDELGPAVGAGGYCAFENCQAYMLDAPDIPGLARLHDIVQGLHRLLDRGLRVQRWIW